MAVITTTFIRACVCLIVIGLIYPLSSSAEIDAAAFVGAWLFEEGGGQTIKDSSGAGNDGAIQGAPKWVNGKFGKALDFDGKAHHVIIPHADNLNLNHMTVAAWIRLRNYADDARIISKEDGVVDPWSIYSLQISGAGDTKLEFRPTVNNQRKRVESNADVPLNEWTHVAATFDGSEVVLYLNGEIEKLEQHAGEMMQNDKDVWMGASEFWTPRFFDGLMDDAALLNIALTQRDIQDMMETGLAGTLAVSPAGKLTTTWGRIKRL